LWRNGKRGLNVVRAGRVLTPKLNVTQQLLVSGWVMT
jgi:hypothetical protein